MINFPLFPVRTPEIFYERLLAFKEDPATGKPDPAQVKVFEERLAGGPRACGRWHVDARSSRGGGTQRRHGHHLQPADVASWYGAFGRSGNPRSFGSLCGIVHPARRRDETAERDHARADVKKGE